MWHRLNTNAVCRKETGRIVIVCLKVDIAGSNVSVILLCIWCMMWACTEFVCIPTGRVWTSGFRYRIHVCLVLIVRMLRVVDYTPLCGFMVCYLNSLCHETGLCRFEVNCPIRIRKMAVCQPHTSEYASTT